MRYVVRQHTRTRVQPFPPWSIRESASVGTPRTLLTNMRDPVTVDFAGRKVVTGHLDWLLRLYSHHGATKTSAYYRDDAGVEYVAYDEAEWLQVTQADWLELVDDTRSRTCRTSMGSAIQYGRMVDTARGRRWVVPVSTYTTQEE